MSLTTNCYVTGKPGIAYTFGGLIALYLTQEAYAHFIIRETKNAVAQQIKKDMDELKKKVAAFGAKHLLCLRTDPQFIDNLSEDDYINVTIEMHIDKDNASKLVTQLTECAMTTLRSMRQDYQRTGKLTS